MESRLYAESMSGATAKSNPTNDKLDRKELTRLQRQDYWIQVTRLKLLMDLIFVCESQSGTCVCALSTLAGYSCPLFLAYDVFRLKRGKGQVQTFAGLASALLR